MLSATKTLPRHRQRNWSQLTLFAVATPAPSIAAPEVTGPQSTPTSPATSSPWSGDCALNGWSARTFLHQLCVTSAPHWTSSDTEALLSDASHLHLRASFASGTTLSDAIKTPGRAQRSCFRTAEMVRGLIRRALARGKSLRLLLRTEQDTIPVIVIFGNQEMGLESWTLRSGKPLPDSLGDGLLDFLKQHAPGCAAMP